MQRNPGVAQRIAARFLHAPIRTVNCSACDRFKAEVAHMIAGPNVYLCEHCVAQAAGQLAPRDARTAGTTPRKHPRRPAPDAVRCRFCHQLSGTGEVTTAGSVIVCADCLGTMTSILTEAT